MADTLLEIDGIDLHFLHVEGRGPAPVPLGGPLVGVPDAENGRLVAEAAPGCARPTTEERVATEQHP